VFDVNDDGSIHNGRLFYRLVGREPGVADGMKVDVEGNVYCTGPAGIHVVSPSGELLGRIKIPGHSTNLCFGDDDWKGLYVTTYDSVFKVRLGVAGIAVW
jgi:gluconolactonase